MKSRENNNSCMEQKSKSIWRILCKQLWTFNDNTTKRRLWC